MLKHVWRAGLNNRNKILNIGKRGDGKCVQMDTNTRDSCAISASCCEELILTIQLFIPGAPFENSEHWILFIVLFLILWKIYSFDLKAYVLTCTSFNKGQCVTVLKKKTIFMVGNIAYNIAILVILILTVKITR